MTQSLINALTHYGLLIVFVTMVAESACIPIPSEVVVPYGGFLAAQGHTHLWMVIVVATVANLVGSSIAYAVGRYGGRALFVRYGRYVGVSAHHLDKADRWFVRYGPVTVFFTRMMPGVRTFISLPAGIAKMPVVKFLLYSLFGSVIWNTALAYLGYAAGKAAGHRMPWDKSAGHVQPLQPHLVRRAGGGGGRARRLGVWRWRRHRSRAASQESSESSQERRPASRAGAEGGRPRRAAPRRGPWRGRAWSALPGD